MFLFLCRKTMSFCLPSWILRELRIEVNLFLLKRQQIVLCTELALQDDGLAPSGHLSITRILLGVVEVAYALELLTGLDVERILREEQPALQILPAEALEGQFTGTLTTNLVDELLLISRELRSHVSGTYTVAEHVDGIFSRTATVGLEACTTRGSTCLGIEQIDIGHTHVGQIGLKGTTPIVHTVELVALVRNEFLAEVTCAAAVGVTLRIACGRWHWEHRHQMASC